MKKIKIPLLSLFLMLVFITNHSQAAGQWRFPVQLTYVNGILDVSDLYKENLEAEGYTITSDFVIPVAIAFNPCYEFNFGLRLGGGVGPLMLVLTGEKNHFGIPLWSLSIRPHLNPWRFAGSIQNNLGQPERDHHLSTCGN